MVKRALSRLFVAVTAVLFLAACGGSAATPASVPSATSASTLVPAATSEPLATIAPTTTSVPTAAPTAMSAPTNTPLPLPTETPALVDIVDPSFADVAACLEEQLGSDAARELVLGERQETPEEEAVLLDCVVASALEPPEETPVSSLEACLAEKLGAEIAPLVASRAIPLSDEEAAALNGCLLTTALTTEAETLDAAVMACLEASLGADLASVVASGAIPLTESEEQVLGDCVLGSGLEVSEEGGLNPGVAACLEERLGAEVAAVVASGAIPLNEEEEGILGECLLSPSSDTTTETVSEGVAACLEEQLGAEIAAVVASGVIPLTEQEEAVMGDCLLQEALGGAQ